MNPLTELHDRLAYVAVAGTALLDEDFRLKKTMEGFAALAEKNPVFAKIHTGLTALFEAAPAERGTQILNLLGLVDAVLYTQADYGIQGDLIPFSQNTDETHIRQIHYSALIPIIQALTNTGSGRIEVIRNALEEHPEYFADFRVVRALIDDLTDSYSEMAGYSMRILQSLATGQPMELTNGWEEINVKVAYLPQIDSKQLIELLKYNFNPASKTNLMKKRLILICTIAGGAENDWYLSLLEQAGKEIRPLVIFALGFREENIPLLLELAQKERGKAEEMAYRGLAQWDRPEVLALFQQTMEKKPKLAAYLSDTDFYGDFVAEHLQKTLVQLVDQPHISREQMDETIDPWLCALKNKASDGVIALYRWCIQNGNKIPKIQELTPQPKMYSMLSYLDQRISETLILRCPRKLTDCLQEENVQTEVGLLADLLTLPAAQVYEKWGETRKIWIRNLSLMKSASGEKVLCARSKRETGDPFARDELFYYRPIKEPLDWRWIEFFIHEKLDESLEILDPETMPEAWKTRVGSYYYQQALNWEHWYRVSEPWFCKMEQLGWKNYENILVRQCKLHDRYYSTSPTRFIFWILEYYEKYAGRQAAVEEAQRVMDFYLNTKKDPQLEAELFEAFQAHGWLKET